MVASDVGLALLIGPLMLILLRPEIVAGCGIMTHIEIAQRMMNYFDVQSQGNDYRKMILTNQDAMQAGAPFPDAFYSGLCMRGEYNQVSEDTHWTPFLNASVNYIRRQYPLPWDDATKKLVVFLLGVAQHQVADATWHSLDIDQGFLEAMAQVNYYGNFGAAHSDGDLGGDIMNLYELNTDYIGAIAKWYVPTDDLVNIYAELYGTPDKMNSDVINNCTFILFLGRLGEGLGVIDLLYPRYAARSPFLLDMLNGYFLGAVDDMATWSGNVWKEMVTMLDYGTNVCDLPENPIYIECRGPSKHTSLVRSRRSASFNEKYFGFLQQIAAIIDPEDIVIRRNGRGTYFSPSKKLRRWLKKKMQHNRRSKSSVEPFLVLNTTASVFYETGLEYSRLGHKMVSGDVNGDGFDDVIICAPGFSSPNNYQQGRVYIVYGSAEGIPSLSSNLDTSADLILDGPGINGRFGISAAVVDINADGVNDLAVSAPSIGSDTLDYWGQVYIYLGQSSGPLPLKPSITIDCTERFCNLGWSLASGDMNMDGFSDLIIGSPFAPSSGKQRGMVAALYASSSFESGLNLTEANFNWRWDGLQDYEWLGYSVSAGRISTGETWLVAGAPTFRLCFRPDCAHSSSDTQAVGKVYVFRSQSPGRPVATLTGVNEFSQLGSFVAVATYSNADILILSSISSVGEGNRTESGIVELYNISQNTVESRPFATLSGDMEFDRFGSDVKVYTSRKDGKSHILVSAPYRSETLLSEREAGRVYEFNTIDSNTAKQADMTYIMDVDRSQFGSSVIVIESTQKQQLVIGAQHFNLPRGQLPVQRLTGRVAVFEL